MKKFFKILGIIAGSLLLLIAAFVAVLHFKSLPTYEVNIPDIQVQPDSALIARGEYLVSLNCQTCHLGKDGTLSGKFMEEGPLGKFYVPNITRHETAGIGHYSDGELAYLLRTGVKPDGSLSIPIMNRFPDMAEEDLKAIIAFLRSDHRWTRPSDRVMPQSEITLLGKALMHFAFEPLPYPESSPSAPSPADPVAYGEYLTNEVILCYHCHSASFTELDLMEPHNSMGYLGGGNAVHNHMNPKELVLSSNITPHRETGIGNWNADQFYRAVTAGQGPDGNPLSPAMPRFTTLSREDADAIWAFLQTVPPLDNDVSQLELAQE